MKKRKFNEEAAYEAIARDIKVKNLPALVCSKDKEHKYIQTHADQKMCLFCEWGKPYPPPTPVNLRDPDDWDVPEGLDSIEV